MIEYNLKEERYKNHPNDYKYGVITGNVGYAGYPVTIVDNTNEKPALCLIHLNERVREYYRLRLYEEFLYLSFAFGEPTYKMYDYKYEELTTEQIIQDLKTVLYYSEPNLQSRSLVGCSSDAIEDDINYYEGYYVLNNEEEYTILKYKDEYKFYKGKKYFYPDWGKDDDLIYKDKIDFDLYKIALACSKLRTTLVKNTNYLLDEDNIVEKITEYDQLKSQLIKIFNIK